MCLSKTKNSFIEGAFILVVANALTKIIGAIFKIPLSNLMGSEGMGLFDVAYGIYTALFVIATAGLPVAISKMVSESRALGRREEASRIVSVALSAFAVFGLAATAVLWFGADLLAAKVGNSGAAPAVRAIAPSLFFVSVMSIIRGYYQGLSDMRPTAISQVLEAVGKLSVGYVAAWLMLKRGLGIEMAAAGAIFGVTCGSALSFLYLVLKKWKETRVSPLSSYNGQVASRGTLLKRLIATAIPVTVGASVISLTNLLDMAMVMNRLQDIGFSEKAATELYGSLGLARNIFNLPQTLIVAVSISIIPAISAAYAKGRYDSARRTTETALRVASLIALPAAAGLFALSGPILKVIYYKRPEDCVTATPLLTVLSIAVIFVAMVSLTNSILQAMGRVRVPVYTMLIGGAVKLTVNYFLIGNPKINILGAPIGTTLCYAVITVLNLIVIGQCGLRLNYFSIYLKAGLASLVMGGFAWIAYPPAAGLLGEKLGVLAVIAAAALVYLVLVIVLRVLPKEDIMLLPKGDKIAKILRIH